jgi:HK97 family phage major capsid protein
MSKLLEILQERQQVFAELQDLRGKRSGGKFDDAATETHYQNANKRFEELTKMKADAEMEQEQRRLMLLDETEQREKNKVAPPENAVTYDQAFWRYCTLPNGATLSPDEKRMLETRGTSSQITTTDSLGGFTVPQKFSDQLENMMKWYGGMLGNCGDFTDESGGILKYPTLDDTGTSGAVIAQTTGATVADLTFGNVLFTDYTIDSKIIKMSNELMADNRVGLVQATLADLLPTRLGRAVNSALTNGTGTNQPYGLTTTVTNAALTTAGATAITQAELVRAIHSVDKAYRQGPKVQWMMSDTIMGYIRTLDIGNTNTVQIFYPSLVEGEPDRLMGYPIVINNDLAAANATTRVPVTATKSVYFGDFSKYKIRRIGGINLSQNNMLYWASREVGFMGWLRLDGNLINANAIKYILQA